MNKKTCFKMLVSVLALCALRDRFLGTTLWPRDEWECRLLSAASPGGVSLPPEALTSDGLCD